jgi:hypothetical protein
MYALSRLLNFTINKTYPFSHCQINYIYKKVNDDCYSSDHSADSAVVVSFNRL